MLHHQPTVSGHQQDAELRSKSVKQNSPVTMVTLFLLAAVTRVMMMKEGVTASASYGRV